MSEKLQKVLARAGLASRREIETWIEAGRISVNNKVATLGDRVTGDEYIQVDGRAVRLQASIEAPMGLIYHKDIGTICSRSDEEGRPTVFADFPKIRNQRWILVGRLDFNTSGLLLVTTDGDLAHRLMHPSYEIEREYAVRIYGDVTPSMLETLQRGVALEDGEARFEKITDIGGEGQNHWFNVVLKEGKNREVRRLWESQGVQVNRLSRNRFGPVSLPRSVKRGQHRELTHAELDGLYNLVSLPPPFATAKKAATKSAYGDAKKPRTKSAYGDAKKPRTKSDYGDAKKPRTKTDYGDAKKPRTKSDYGSAKKSTTRSGAGAEKKPMTRSSSRVKRKKRA